ncbi:hypothetical protein QJQ45_029512 [Haematococcus lacustris]|nr:hypothetical protein QJQ45_029512 [Haematococcus lacustris]
MSPEKPLSFIVRGVGGSPHGFGLGKSRKSAGRGVSAESHGNRRLRARGVGKAAGEVAGSKGSRNSGAENPSCAAEQLWCWAAVLQSSCEARQEQLWCWAAVVLGSCEARQEQLCYIAAVVLGSCTTEQLWGKAGAVVL